jgi:GntR family transcriptional regulator, N-acetylglucosamine utilization regulator
MNPSQEKFEDAGKMIHSHVPKYYYLRESLREEIHKWPTNYQIPSEAELCDAYNVSRTTVRKALDYLIFEGLLYRVQGKGTFVSPTKVLGRYIQSTAGFWKDARNQGLNLKTEVIEQQIIEANASVAKALKIKEGTKVFNLVRLRSIDDVPVMLTPAFIPYDLCGGILAEDLSNQSFYQVLQERFGVSLNHGTQLIEAQPCSEEDAGLLEIEPGTPILVTIGLMYDHDGRPVEFSIAKSRGDRLRCEVKIVAAPE